MWIQNVVFLREIYTAIRARKKTRTHIHTYTHTQKVIHIHTHNDSECLLVKFVTSDMAVSTTSSTI